MYEIELLKQELNKEIENGLSFMEVYELSVKLDKLILQYYTRELPKPSNKVKVSGREGMYFPIAANMA